MTLGLGIIIHSGRYVINSTLEVVVIAALKIEMKLGRGQKRKKFWEKAVDLDELCGKGESWWGVRGQMHDDFSHKNKEISLAEHFESSRFVESVLDVYWELPPVAGPSLTLQTRYDPARAPDAIIEDGRFGLFRRLGLTTFDTSLFNGHTQMVYLEISPVAAAA